MAADILTGVPLGTRVVVRHLIEGGRRATDVLGPLLERTQDHLVVATKRGPVTISVAAVVAAKPVPPAPERRSARRVR